MMTSKTALVLLSATAIALVAYVFSDQRYDHIEGGMTPAEVEQVMGRPPDTSSLSAASHFEEWSLGKACLWVEYDEQGHVIAKGLDEIRNLPSGESAIELERESFLDGAGAGQ